MKPNHCKCTGQAHQFPNLVVLTGGPGAGKTAVLEIIRRKFCEHVSILPESASVIFTGGFWRHDTLVGKKAAQRAIFHVQREMEAMILEEGRSAILLCDRGTIDGLAYWPETENSFWNGLMTSREEELGRYKTVIHLRTPTLELGYNHRNPLRLESADQAATVDQKIEYAWRGHPRRFFVDSSEDFIEKTKQAVNLIQNELPDCCRL